MEELFSVEDVELPGGITVLLEDVELPGGRTVLLEDVELPGGRTVLCGKRRVTRWKNCNYRCDRKCKAGNKKRKKT